MHIILKYRILELRFVGQAVNLNSKVSLFQTKLLTTYQKFFPEVTKKVFSTAKPNINEKIKGLVNLKLKVFHLGKKDDAVALHKQMKKEIRLAACRHDKKGMAIFSKSIKHCLIIIS